MSKSTITTPPEYKEDNYSPALRRDKNSKFKPPELTWQDYELSPIPSTGWCATGTAPPLPKETLEKWAREDAEKTNHSSY